MINDATYSNEELEVMVEITTGLKENGWLLKQLEKRGNGWVFFIEPIEELDKKKRKYLEDSCEK